MGRKSGRALNPADQYRKEQHKKELKKNKQDRKKVREVNAALRDTTTETEIEEYEDLEKVGKLDKDGTKKLAELKDKMNKIIEIKKAHGIKIKSKKVEAPKPVPVAEQARDPTRSIYYDPVLNPFGAPPPGQPYLEYPPLPTQPPFDMESAPGTLQQPPQESEGTSGSGSDGSDSDSNSGSEADSDSDSSSSGSESDDTDDENYMPPLPEGPAPSKEDQARFLELTKPKMPIAPRIQQQPWPPAHIQPGIHPPGMPHPGMPGPPIIPYGPPGFQPPFGNVYPPGRPNPGLLPMGTAPHHSGGPGFGPPPPGYGAPVYGHPGGYGPPGLSGPPPPLHARPPRPPPRYTKPPRTTPSQSDPMTGHLPPDEKELKRTEQRETATLAKSSTTIGALDASAPLANNTTGPAVHPLPPKPTSAQVPPKPALVAGPASISAEPQLRNLQKELVHLVPSTIMRKRVTQKGKIGRPVNAAPGVDEDDDHVAAPSFVEPTFSPHSGTKASRTTTSTTAYGKEDEDSDQEQRETGLGLRLPRINLAPSVPSLLGGSKIVVNSAPEVPVAVDKAAQKKAEYDNFLQGLQGDGLI